MMSDPSTAQRHGLRRTRSSHRPPAHPPPATFLPPPGMPFPAGAHSAPPPPCGSLDFSPPSDPPPATILPPTPPRGLPPAPFPPPPGKPFRPPVPRNQLLSCMTAQYSGCVISGSLRVLLAFGYAPSEELLNKFGGQIGRSPFLCGDKGPCGPCCAKTP